MSKHTCHAIDCNACCPPKMFMCLRHWRMLPKFAQNDIWKEYRLGQEIRKNPSNEYIKAAQRAQILVLNKEKNIDIIEASRIVLKSYGVEV